MEAAQKWTINSWQALPSPHIYTRKQKRFQLFLYLSGIGDQASCPEHVGKDKATKLSTSKVVRNYTEESYLNTENASRIQVK
jgi:hypothetical protein